MKESADLFTRVWGCVTKALPKAGKTCLWLCKIILPISLLVRLLEYSGALAILSGYIEPVFSLIGLPGKTAVVFITSIFCPLYASIALIATFSLGVREATILAVMCLTAHNLIVESSVQAKTGSSFWGMTFLRIGMAFVIAFTLNRVMPAGDWGSIGETEMTAASLRLQEVFVLWFFSSMKVVLSILLIVTGLMIVHSVLEEFKCLKGLSTVFAPLMKLFGLPKDAAFLWLVGNLVGLAYGGAIMREQMEEKKLSYRDGNILNYHLAICHSLLEDTLIFVAIGIPAFWIIVTRLFFALAVVWARRGVKWLTGR
ncbi:nucleoside recognition protein [Parabacteroides sp. 52]|nr:nucleoside recognition protein [Parabacteroides sp. 52]